MIIRSRAPLRLGFAGGGTDLSPFCDTFGGYVLNATIDMYAYAMIETRSDRRLSIVASDIGARFEDDAEASPVPDGELALHQAVYSRIMTQFCGGDMRPLTLTTYCDAPPGSGLGSSSTLVVAMVKAFVELLSLPLGEYDIARLAYEIERIDLKLSGGRQDQYAATFGGFNFMEFYENERVIVNPLRVKNWILSELESSLLLFDTSTSRSSARIIDEQIRNVRQNELDPVEATKELKQDALMMKEAVLKGDFVKFATFMERSWIAKKRTAMNVTTPRIEEIFAIARGAGTLAGKVSGAGGGGYIMFIVDPVKRMSVIAALGKTEGHVRNCHFTKHGSEGWRLD
jgi:D-glycero-alpha-D-manno-heptose-7-phosphate kinase